MSPETTFAMVYVNRLIARIMRVLTASQMVDEVDTDTYAANELTRAFLQPGLEDAIRHR